MSQLGLEKEGGFPLLRRELCLAFGAGMGISSCFFLAEASVPPSEQAASS